MKKTAICLGMAMAAPLPAANVIAQEIYFITSASGAQIMATSEVDGAWTEAMTICDLTVYITPDTVEDFDSNYAAKGVLRDGGDMLVCRWGY